MRWAPKPSAAPSTAAGATSQPTGWCTMSTILMTTTITDAATIDTQEMTDATAWRCLVALRAHQRVAFREAGVDAPGDPLRAPVDEPGREHRGDEQQHDPQTPGDDPFADGAAPEVVPAPDHRHGMISCRYSAC